MTNPAYYLYHMRDPEKSAGFGFDGYLGITNNPRRRYAEHMGAAAREKHPNKRFQALFNESGGNLKMRIVRKGTADEVLASEALIINRPNKHANVQAGGGRLRGLSQQELLARSGLGKQSSRCHDWTPPPGSISPRQAALIAAATVAIACGAYYGYRRWKKSKRNAPDTAGQTAAALSSDEERRVAEEVAARQARIEKMKGRFGPPLHRRIWNAINALPDRPSEPDDPQRVAEEIAARQARLETMRALRKPLQSMILDALIAPPDGIQSVHARQLAEERAKRHQRSTE